MRNWDTGIDWTQWQGPAHPTVVDVDGNKIGKLAEIHAVEGYLRVKHGQLRRQDWYVPLGAVSRIADQQRIVLRYTKAELAHQPWTAPPQAQPKTATLAATQVARPVATNMAQEQASVVTPPAPQVAAAPPLPATTVPLREEELVPRKEWHEEGSVHVHKDVVEEPATVSAAVVHETVHVEHIAPDPDRATSADTADAFKEESFAMPVLGEELVAEKRTKVSDELRLHKESVVKNAEVTGTVRREQINLSGTDGASIPPDDDHLAENSAQW